MSDPRFARAGDPRFLIGQLREQLRELADQVAPYADPPKPTMTLRRDSGETGQVWEVRCHEGARPLAVIALDHEAGVFIQGADFSYYGDWHALRSDGARSFALALLAAADWSDRKHGGSGLGEVQA